MPLHVWKTRGLKFQRASHCQKYKASEHLGSRFAMLPRWVFTAGHWLPLIFLPPFSSEQTGCNLKNSSNEKNNVDKCQWSHRAGMRHISSLDLHAFLHVPWSHERATLSVFLSLIDVLMTGLRNKNNPASAPSKISPITWMGQKAREL